MLFLNLIAVASLHGWVLAPDQEIEIGNWGIYRHDSYCSATTESDGIGFTVMHNRSQRSPLLTLTGPSFASVENKREYQLDIRLVDASRAELKWGAARALGTVTKDARGYLIIPSKTDFLSQFAGASAIRFYNQNVLVAAIPTNKAGEVAAALRDCVARFRTR